MKKLFVLSLALVLTFGLLACGEAEGGVGLEDAPGNAEIEVDTPTDPTITDPAENDPAPCQHVWVDATCSAPKTCSLCQTTEGEPSAESHTMSGWQLYIDGQGYAPDENRNSCTVCGIYESKLNFDRMMFRYADLAHDFGSFEKGQMPYVEDVISAAFWGGVPCESTDVDFVYYHTIKIADLDDFTQKCLGTTYDYTQIQNLPVLWESICNYDAEKNAIVIRSFPAGGGDGFMRDQVTWTTEDDIHYTVTVKYVSYEEEGLEYTQVFTMEKAENNYIITSVDDPSNTECDHQWLDATCSAPKTCSLCQATEGEIGTAHTLGEPQLLVDGNGYAPDQYLESCIYCDDYSLTKLYYDAFFREYLQLALQLGEFAHGSLPDISNVITAAFRYGVDKVYTPGDTPGIMYYTFSVEDLNDFTMKCLGTTYDYTNVQNLSVLYEASCNYDAENNTIVITVLPAGGGGGYELLNYALTSEDQISFTFTAQLMDENGETLDFSFIVDHTGDNYIFWEITSR